MLVVAWQVFIALTEHWADLSLSSIGWDWGHVAEWLEEPLSAMVCLSWPVP